jgi:hypothetical protein
MKIRTLACVVAALPYTAIVHAQSAAPAADGSVVSMEAIKVEASADASAGGLAQPYAGGQVARGGRVGVAYWPVLKGPVLRIFVIDAALFAANLGVALLLVSPA